MSWVGFIGGILALFAAGALLGGCRKVGGLLLTSAAVAVTVVAAATAARAGWFATLLYCFGFLTALQCGYLIGAALVQLRLPGDSADAVDRRTDIAALFLPFRRD